MAELFKDIIPSIMTTKQPCLEDEKEYPPYVVNKALSFHYDALPFAFIMDQNSHLSPRMQYDFLLHSVRGMKRKFVPWHKAHKSSDIDLIRRHYGYSYRKALEALQILTEEQLEDLRKLYKYCEE